MNLIASLPPYFVPLIPKGMHLKPVTAPFTFCLVDANDARQQRQIATSWMRSWLSYKLKETADANCAVVFDIDDTLVDRNERPIPPLMQLYHWCAENHIRCFVVTARPESTTNRMATSSMLAEHGIVPKHLYMMPATSGLPSPEQVSRYKRQCREEIAQRYKILGNFGDMWWDVIRLPVERAHSVLHERDERECAILFPPQLHGEAAMKLPSLR